MPEMTASFADLLKRHRVAADFSQNDLAERASLSATAVSELKRGVRRAPYRETVAMLADALHRLQGKSRPPAASRSPATTHSRRSCERSAIRPSILVLDNCEQILTGAAAAAAAILRACPNVTILATSRERLSIAGEAVFRLSTLPVPEANIALTAADVRAYATLELFVERAAAADPHFV